MTLVEYQIIGRKAPTNANPNPKCYRMRLFAPNVVVAKSRFWYFLSQFHKVKKAHGEILAVNRLYEKKPLKVKNFAVLLRYNSRTGTHNMYKEFRDLTREGAVNQLYMEMAAKHRATFRSIQIIDVNEIPSSKARRPSTIQFHGKVKFPLPHNVIKASQRKFRQTFRRTRPTTYFK